MLSSPSRRPFEFIANHIVLDFTNTVNARPHFTRDDLGSAADLADWALAAGLVDRQAGIASGTDSGRGLDGVIQLRESLYAVFGPIAAGGEPADEALSVVAGYAADALRSSRLVRHEEQMGYRTSWSLNSFESLGHFLADEAMQLLRSPGVQRVGSCDGCGWLFLDTSRAGARRWCSMNVCGARHKMRRYHERHSATPSAI